MDRHADKPGELAFEIIRTDSLGIAMGGTTGVKTPYPPIQLRDTPDALCGALMLLVSGAGRWITGQVLNVDGGWVMRG